MSSALTFEDLLGSLAAAGTALADLATDVSPEAAVPTCPAWNVRALVAHQAMVHRWATAHVTGADPDKVPTQTTIRETIDDLDAFYRQGLAALLDALRSAPEDLRAMTFLNEAPPPRQFWARRQVHETTIHMVDALGAGLGREATAAESGIDDVLALDGIDELLVGFFTRGRSKLFDGTEYSIAVAPLGTERCWTATVAERLTVTREAPVLSPEVVVSGSAPAIYLTLWNRSDEADVSGRPEVLTRWRATQRVRWS